MNISTRRVENVVVVDIAGRIVLGEAGALREMILMALAAGERMFLLNLAEVQYIDSTGLGELIYMHTSVKKHGCRIQFLKLTNKVRDLLQITKLYTVLDIKENEAEAIASLNQPDVIPKSAVVV